MPDDVLNGILDSASNDQSATSTGRTPLVIDSDLRTIQVPTDYVFGVQNDKDVLSVPFIVPRYYDGVDLSELSIRVNFTTKSGLSSYYDVETITINSDTIEFSWLLGAAVFVSVGDLTFAVCIRQVETDGRITREFNTTLATAKILPGLEVENTEDPSQYSILVQMQNIAERAESYVGAPLTALTEDDMTDTSRIYVYVGEETGYTNGHWYYYSDDVWHDGGIYNAVAQMVDDTLTEEGVAADAKATGDVIAELDDSIQNGIHPDLYAGNLTTDKAQTDKTPYLFRKTGGNLSRVGERCCDTIVGASVGENQLAQIKDTDASGTVSGVTFTDNRDGSFKLNGTATAGFNKEILKSVDVINAHKYLVLVGDQIALTDTQTFSSRKGDRILNASASATITFNLYITNGATFNNYTIKPNIIDLSLYLPANIVDYIYSLESATAGAGIAKLRSWGFLRGYQAYNAGSIESVEVTGKVVRGFNAWDEEWEVGSINTTTGENLASNNYLRSKNYIRVIGNATYNLHMPWAQMFFYDADKNFLRTTSNGITEDGAIHDKTLTMASDVYYIRFRCTGTYGTTYNNDICINLSSDRNGEYEAYVSQSYDYGDDTLNGIFKLDASNNLYADGDRKESDGTITRKYGVYVFDGTESWTYITSWSVAGFRLDGSAFLEKIPNAKLKGMNVLCNMYTNVGNDFVSWEAIPLQGDKSIGSMRSYTGICLRDDSCTSVNQLKAVLMGKRLIYELATPTTETSTPFTSPQVCYPYGTEEFITETPVPVGHETIYPYDLKAQAERLIDVPDVPSTNGTYVLKATRTSNGLTYSWVSG